MILHQSRRQYGYVAALNQEDLYCILLRHDSFLNQFQKKNIPENIEELSLEWEEPSILLPNLLKESGMTESTSEAIRMIKQGGVRINEEKITDPKHLVSKGEACIYQVGKRKFKKITL